MKTYLIDYEMRGTLVVDAANPQAAAMRAGAPYCAVLPRVSTKSRPIVRRWSLASRSTSKPSAVFFHR